jgi:hypothetical protein
MYKLTTTLLLFTSQQCQELGTELEVLHLSNKQVEAVRQDLFEVLQISIRESRQLIKARNEEYYKIQKMKAKTEIKAKMQNETGTDRNQLRSYGTQKNLSTNRFQLLEDFEPDVSEPVQEQVIFQFPTRRTTIERDQEGQPIQTTRNQLPSPGSIVEDTEHRNLFWSHNSLSTPPNYERHSEKHSVLVYPPKLGELLYNQRFKILLVQIYQVMRAGGFQQILMHLQKTKDQPTTCDQTFSEIEEDFNRMYKHIQKFADIIYFLNWHCTEPIALRLMNLIQWITTSPPSDATLLLTELSDYRGIFEEITPQGTKYTFKPIPSPRIRRKKESIQAEEPIIPAQVNFSIQHRSTNQAEYTEIAERLNLIIANFNNSRTNKDPHKWIEIKQEIKEIKTDIQKTTKISLYHAQRILNKVQQVNDRILRTITYMKKNNHFGNQNHITNYFQTEDQNSTFDTYD